MKIKLVPRAQKIYRKLPPSIQKKADKSFKQLLKNPKYPSLHIKKMKTTEEIWEARIDYHYRFTFIIIDDVYTIISIGLHDKGLGKK